MALPIRLMPHWSQALIIEKRAMITIACQGLSLLAQPEMPFRSHLTGGEQARI